MENIKSRNQSMLVPYSSYRGYINQSTISRAKEATYKARMEPNGRVYKVLVQTFLEPREKNHMLKATLTTF